MRVFDFTQPDPDEQAQRLYDAIEENTAILIGIAIMLGGNPPRKK